MQPDHTDPEGSGEPGQVADRSHGGIDWAGVVAVVLVLIVVTIVALLFLSDA